MNDALQELTNIVNSWTQGPHERVCAVCLCEVPRSKYDVHMQAHGYETISLGHIKVEPVA